MPTYGAGSGWRRERLDRRQRLDETAVRDALVQRVRRAEIGLQRLALDVLDQPPADVRVRENRDREIALGNDLEQQDVAGQRAAMRGGANRTDGAQMPRDADVVVGALLAELRRAHQLERLAREHALAIRRGAVAQWKRA